MLGLQKQQHKHRHAVLEEQLVELLVQAMERAEIAPEQDSEAELGVSHWLWHHLCSQIIYFVLFQFASFSHLVTLLHEKLAERKLLKGRDQIMWVLLQFISGSIQKNPPAEFLPLLRL
jgi:mediator of RNA polymerase II transcription subunit 23